jgi:glycosyltransferase involved in cell wall biosynthesis
VADLALESGPAQLARQPAADPAVRRCLWLTKGLGRGGVERLLVDMLPLVDRARYAVDVAYVLPWKDNYRRAIEEQGALVHCLGSHRAGDPRWVYRLRQLIERRSYDVIHTHAPVPAIAVRLLTMTSSQRPVIVHTEHNLWDRYRRATRLANSATYHRNGAVIAVSDNVARSIRPWPPGRAPSVRTVHHGTVLTSVRSWPPEDRRARRRSLGLPDDGFVIGNVGNFTAKKDHRSLLAALAGDGPIAGAHLALVGLGPLEGELRQAAAELGVAERTTFLGSRDDVFELLPLFDLFCVSSQYEGFPIALVEAMASGLACVATSVGGIPEIVEDGRNGLLVEARDPAALRAAIERMMLDADLARRCGREARVAAERLDLRHAVRQLEAAYQEALEATG